MVNINIPLPDSCASCPLSVRHFGKLYCPPLDGRVGNEGKDERCPLVDAGDRSDLISRQMLLEYIHGEPVGRLLCDKYNLDGLIEQLPSAQPELIEKAAYIRGFEQGRMQGMIDAQGGKK